MLVLNCAHLAQANFAGCWPPKSSTQLPVYFSKIHSSLEDRLPSQHPQSLGGRRPRDISEPLRKNQAPESSRSFFPTRRDFGYFLVAQDTGAKPAMPTWWESPAAHLLPRTLLGFRNSSHRPDTYGHKVAAHQVFCAFEQMDVPPLGGFQEPATQMTSAQPSCWCRASIPNLDRSRFAWNDARPRTACAVFFATKWCLAASHRKPNSNPR